MPRLGDRDPQQDVQTGPESNRSLGSWVQWSRGGGGSLGCLEGKA